MSSTFIKVSTISNVGNDPEIRTFPNGNRVANFSVATSESWRDRETGEKKVKTEWHRVAVLSKGLIGIVEKYVKKGSRLYLEGTLKTRKWEDREGVTKYTTEIVLSGYNGVIRLLDSKPQTKPVGHDERDQDAGEYPEELDDEIPM